MISQKEYKNYKNNKKYKQQYISNLNISHPYFGNCVFEKDCNLGKITLINRLKNISFGCNNKIDKINIVISEKNIDYILNLLEEIFRNADLILEECYPKIQEIITGWGEIDEEGKPVNIDYVRNKYKIIIMEVDDENVVFLGKIYDSIGEDVLGGQGINIYIDLKSKEIDCIVE